MITKKGPFLKKIKKYFTLKRHWLCNSLRLLLRQKKGARLLAKSNNNMKNKTYKTFIYKNLKPIASLPGFWILNYKPLYYAKKTITSIFKYCQKKHVFIHFSFLFFGKCFCSKNHYRKSKRHQKLGDSGCKYLDKRYLKRYYNRC